MCNYVILLDFMLLYKNFIPSQRRHYPPLMASYTYHYSSTISNYAILCKQKKPNFDKLGFDF